MRKSTKKLSLQKTTVARLDHFELNLIKGGTDRSASDCSSAVCRTDMGTCHIV